MTHVSMPPSGMRLRWIALKTAAKAIVQHFVSRKYPKDWSLSFHVQFAILRRIDQLMLHWTVEEVECLYNSVDCRFRTSP